MDAEPPLIVPTQVGGPISRELVTTIRALQESQQDAAVADYLEAVIDNLERYATQATQDQMAGALGNAELTVIHQMARMEDRLLNAIGGSASDVKELHSKLDALQTTFLDWSERVTELEITVGEHAAEIAETKRRREVVDNSLRELTDRIEQIHELDSTERKAIMDKVTEIGDWLQPYMEQEPIDRAALLAEHKRNTDAIARMLRHLGLENA